ncbi:MAG: peptidase P60 [Rhizobiales bacterium]|nr:peptidase P60 [Hyphomicrobiales bacterium]
MADHTSVHDDRRLTPARADLAAKHLEGKVKAARFVEGELREVVAPQAPLRRAPRTDAKLDTEALKGERVMVYESNEEGWSWGQLVNDGYVGWLPTDALRPAGAPQTDTISALRTFVFPGPDIKLTPIETLSFGCKLRIARTQQEFAVTSDNGYVPLQHLGNATYQEKDFVAVADRFVGTPYLWGGKTSLGLDCSALVQVGLTSIGRSCPRDSDLQEQALGSPITPADDFSNLQRGDLLFWKGHVAIVRDNATLVHANAYHMAVAIEPIVDAVARIRAAGNKLTSVRRIEELA